MPTFCTEPVKEEAVFRAAGVTQAQAGSSYEIFRTLAATTEVKKGCVYKMWLLTILLKIHQQVAFTFTG